MSRVAAVLGATIRDSKLASFDSNSGSPAIAVKAGELELVQHL